MSAIIKTQRQEIRTKRYIDVRIRGLDFTGLRKKLYLSWFERSNGLPKSCFLLIPVLQDGIILHLKATTGWTEIDICSACYPKFEISFSLKLEQNPEVVLPNDDEATLQFLLKEKDGEKITTLGEVTILITIKCTKNKADTLYGDMQELKLPVGVPHQIPNQEKTPDVAKKLDKGPTPSFQLFSFHYDNIC